MVLMKGQWAVLKNPSWSMTHFGCLNVLGATTNMFDVPKVNVVNSSRMEDVDATIKKKTLHGGKIIENNENNKTSSKSE